MFNQFFYLFIIYNKLENVFAHRYIDRNRKSRAFVDIAEYSFFIYNQKFNILLVLKAFFQLELLMRSMNVSFYKITYGIFFL